MINREDAPTPIYVLVSEDGKVVDAYISGDEAYNKVSGNQRVITYTKS